MPRLTVQPAVKLATMSTCDEARGGGGELGSSVVGFGRLVVWLKDRFTHMVRGF